MSFGEFKRNLKLAKAAILSTAPDGSVGVVGKGNLTPLAARHTFTLMLGADHSGVQTWGAVNNGIPITSSYAGVLSAEGKGYMQMLLDGGIKPYLATTTAGSGHAPGNAFGMTWQQLVALQGRKVEMLSHSHQHIQRWDRMNVGIYVGYNGTGTAATMQISTTDVILTVTGGGNAVGESVTLTRSAYPTVADLITAIRAVGVVGGVNVWDASLRADCVMLGTESSKCLVPISGARNVRSAGASTIDNRLFCCGGGMHVWCGNSGSLAQIPEHVEVKVRSNGWMVITVDGVTQTYTNLATTFSALVSALNTALNAKGVYFALADNGQSDAGGSNFINYMRGDEIPSGLAGLSDRILAPGNFAIIPGIVEIGLTQDYMRERQYQASIDKAAANGVKFIGFAEPGNQWFPWHMRGFNKFKSYRGTLYSRENQQPVTYPLAALNTPFFVRSSCIYGTSPTGDPQYNVAANMVALAEAMADSPGHACNVLWHSVSTAIGGNMGYELGESTSAGQDQEAANVIAFMNAIAPHIASGKITPSTMGNAADAIPMSPEPFNRLFNANFKNAGLPIPSANTVAMVNNNSIIPGWITSIDGVTSGVSCTIRPDGMLVLTSPNAAVNFSMKQSVILDRNTDWAFGMDVRETNLTGGTGAVVQILRTMGRALNGNNAEASTAIVNAIATAGQIPGTGSGVTMPGQIESRLTLNNTTTGFDAARMIGLVGPFNIQAAVNDTLAIIINGAVTASITLAPGAAVTAAQLAADINNKLSLDVAMVAYPEYWNLAKARRSGRTAAALILGDLQNVFKINVTGTAVTAGGNVIFGGNTSTGQGHTAVGYSGPDMDSGLFAVTFNINVNFQGGAGAMILGRPYIKRMGMM